MFDFSFVSEVISQFHFIRPLWLITLIPLCIVFYLRLHEGNDNQLAELLPAHLKAALTVNGQGWKRQLPLKVLFVGLLFLVVVCAGPTWQRTASPFGEDKATLSIVLDVSESMKQQDVAPSRLERAKHKVHDLLETREGGRTGLIVYSGSAHTVMPPTQDKRVFAPFLAAIDSDVMPVGGKSAEKALPIIKDQLVDLPGSTVLLISDGVTPSTIEHFKRYFSEHESQLLILAMGNPTIDTQRPLDMASLDKLADVTNGRLVEVTIDSTDIDALGRFVERHMQMNGDSAMPWEDMGYLLLFPAALLLMLWFRKGWLVQWSVLLIVSLPMLSPSQAYASQAADDTSRYEQTVEQSSAEKANKGELESQEKRSFSSQIYQWWMDLWFTADQQGQLLLNDQQYLEAAKHFSDPIRKGVSFYYAREFELAHSEFISADSNLGYYYAASALARQREYMAAHGVLKALLDKEDLEPALREKVAHNYQVMNALIEEIDRVSESQTNTTESMEESIELGDNPRTSEGAEEQAAAELMKRETLNANEILGSEELANKWLTRVESDPKLFLQAKFHIQYRDQKNQSTTKQGETDAQ
ncbi:vWA domain-containing protein [Vibrio paucivorans]|uniref:VWA domain-containing protein n=1 Tax=Vibrio paucivorans TaxID=2829489 RepID=A0A9X3CBI5_9VIBR|nr:VWA domain-containing protein [Vibrio paucivorans]MCW8332585.1 VWA domain-containing protein [Vibrio paucivorans]